MLVIELAIIGIEKRNEKKRKQIIITVVPKKNTVDLLFLLLHFLNIP